MHTRSTLNQDRREELVRLFESGMGVRPASRLLGVSRYAVRDLYRRWKLRGKPCLVNKPTHQAYSFETKKEVVARFLAGATNMELAAQYNLSSETLVRQWVKNWRSGGDEALKPRKRGRPKGSPLPEPLSEEDKLRRENARLQAEVAYLKNCGT